MHIENIMFSLIRSEICGSDVNENIKSELTEEDYKALYDISVKHDLSHVVASALMRLKMLENDEVSSDFKKRRMLAVYRDTQRNYAIKLTGDLLEQAKIPHVFLKGSVLCHLYPQSWMRTSCDVDILIHKSDAEMAEKVLCSNGFQRMEDRSTHDFNYRSPNNVHIEMHYSLLQDGKVASSDVFLNEIWSKHVVLEDGCSYRYMMSEEAFIIYHLAHMARHVLDGGCGVRPFLDLWLINKTFSVDRTKLRKILEQCNLDKLFDLSWHLSQVWMEEAVHSEETKMFETYILRGGVYGSFENAAKVKAAKGMNKISSFLDLMFLPRKNLQVLYPKLETYPMLFGYYQVKRWFRVLDKSKRNKIKNMTEKRNNVTAVEAGTVGNLLRQLGLKSE